MNQYLIKYLIDNADDALSKKYLDFFKIELDWHIYNGDAHISRNYHRDKKIEARTQFINFLQFSYAILRGVSGKQPGCKNILTTVSFSQPQQMKQLGFNFFSPIWHPIGKQNIFGDFKTLKWHKRIQNLIRNGDFNLFLQPQLHAELEEFQEHLIQQYQRQDFSALFLYTDQYFYSKYNIDIFKKIGKPSFVFLHGLPAVYSTNVDNRADYLLVWGQKMKENYLKAGFDEDKIKVVGRSNCCKLPRFQNLRSDLSDVLVIPVSSSIYHQHEYDNIILTDKSAAVLYLYQVQSVLSKLGIKKARYRVHPSTDKQWIHAFLDQDFYVADDGALNSALDRSSLVIGSTSTVLLEALIRGVNYVAFEPTDENGLNLLNYKCVPPFDGTEKKLIIANNEQDLGKLLKENAMTEYSLVHDYMQDTDLTILGRLIK